MTVSEPFRLTPSVYFRIAAKRTLPRVALLLAIPFVVLLVAAGVLHDMRFIFIAIMVPFIFAPMVITHIFYSILLHPEARRALRLQNISFTPDNSLQISFLKEDDKKVTQSDTLNPPTDSIQPAYTVTDTLTIPWDRISAIALSTGCLIFYLADSKLPVVLPLTALPPAFNPYEIITY